MKIEEARFAGKRPVRARDCQWQSRTRTEGVRGGSPEFRVSVLLFRSKNVAQNQRQDLRFNPEIYHRRTLRLPNYDYSGPGHWFITICVHNREPMFGEIHNGIMGLNNAGVMVAHVWQTLPSYYPDICCDHFIVMPDHFHGIIERDCRGGSRTAPTGTMKPLGRIVGAFKTMTTKQINLNRKTPGLRLWQRNYYEHVIRDETDYARTLEYMHSNPFSVTSIP